MIVSYRNLWTIAISGISLACCESCQKRYTALPIQGTNSKKPLVPLQITHRALVQLCIPTQGLLQGRRSKTDSGFEYIEFLGIPYAKPPVGELRFKSPQSPDPWMGVKDATTANSNTISYQLHRPTSSIKGNEDCLYLNVYTPTLPVPCSEPKPVMIYIHGGGFVTGNGTLKDENGPDYLIEKDVVIVTINYRLGLLGFLNLDIPEAAGNMGLKDQIKALQWVQNNINNFGGDKDNVTIFGSSSGSASCEFLLLSPLAKGLFHKCILQSGSSLNGWAINYSKKSKKTAEIVARKLGYTGPANNMPGIFKVLFEASALELTRLAFQILGQETLKGIYFGFVPSVERDFGTRDAFLAEPPYKVLKEGKFNKVPVIKGFCNKEGYLASATKPDVIKDLVKTKSFTIYWPYHFDNCDVSKYNSALVAAYIKSSEPNDEAEEFAINFFGDIIIAAGVYIAGKLQCKKLPVYMYKFCYDGKLNKFKVLLKLKQKGAGHSDEAGYILRHVSLASQKLNDADILMRNRMIKMWTNFAKTGNPVPETCAELPVQWPLFTEKSKKYLNICKELTIKADYEPERISIFEEIMDKYEK